MHIGRDDEVGADGSGLGGGLAASLCERKRDAVGLKDRLDERASIAPVIPENRVSELIDRESAASSVPVPGKRSDRPSLFRMLPTSFSTSIFVTFQAVWFGVV